MKLTDKIRKILDQIDSEEITPRVYKPLKTQYLTIRMSEDLLKQVTDIAIKENKPVSRVCRELIERGLK